MVVIIVVRKKDYIELKVIFSSLIIIIGDKNDDRVEDDGDVIFGNLDNNLSSTP